MNEKICISCSKGKDISSFEYRKDTKKYRNQCNGCILEKARQKPYNFSEKKKSYAKNYSFQKKEELADYQRKYIQEHKEERNRKLRIYESQRWKDDELYRLKKLLRNTLLRFCYRFKDGKNIKPLKELGLSLEDLKIFIEEKFYAHPVTGELMNWENQGKGYNKWQLDHIKELHSVNKEDLLKEALHYTNLQPLWYEDHIKKTFRNRGEINDSGNKTHS